MKRFIVALAALMFLSSGFAFAADGVKVEAGIKLWNNEWETKDPNAGTSKFDAGLLIGPAVVVTLPSNVFFEASYLMSVTDYEFKDAITTVKVERADMDLAVGYMFIPEFGLFVGYRSTSLDATFSDAFGSGTATIDFSGPVIGLRANYTFNKMFGIYASAAYLMTESEWKEAGDTFKEDAPGTSFELGLKAMFNKQLSGTLGYRMESFEGDKSKTEDKFSGLTLGIMYAF